MPKIKLSDVKISEPIIYESFMDSYDIIYETALSSSDYAAYAAASDVANYCRNLLGDSGSFSSSTSPTLTAVNTWLSSGCSIIEAKLSSYGYATPVSNTTVLYEWIRDLNTLYAAARAEMSRINVTLSPGERTRGQVFEEMFWKQLDQWKSMDLTTTGATNNTSGNSILGQTLWVGGTSIDSKDTYKDDSDRVKPKFSKGMFNMPGTISQNSAESETED